MAEKIFIDLDEDIIFVVEKVKKSEKGKVILVIPERAALLGSVVSLKLLAAEIAKTDKLVAIVTEDEVGKTLSSKANLIVVPKVADINESTWKEAEELKSRLQRVYEFDKKQLVEERKEAVSEPIQTESSIEKEPVSTPKVSTIEPKKVDVGGFEMIAGGDIAEFKDQDVSDSIGRDISEPVGDTKGEFPKTSRDSVEDLSDLEQSRESLSGRDLNEYDYSSKKSLGRGSRIGKGFSITSIIDPLKAFFSKGGSYNKYIIIGAAIFIGFFLVSYFVLPKGTIVIQVESEDIEIESKITADTSTLALDMDSLTIPAKVLSATRDRSGETNATGKEKTGELASGTVTIYNLQENKSVAIPAGTVLEAIETGLKYETQSNVNVPAKVPDDAPSEMSPGILGTQDVGIQATSFGEDYNVSKKLEFRIAGFDVEKVYAKNFNNITGGTSEEVTVVSQQDYKDLKNKLKDELKGDLTTALHTEAGTSREILEDTIDYEVIFEDQTPLVGTESTTFNLSVTVKATALSFLKEDINSLASTLVEQSNDENVEVEDFEYSSKIKSVEGEKITIKLVITGVVTPSINEDDLRAQLSGANVDKAEEYLAGQEEITGYTYELTPSYLPGFLKHFPSSASRIEVEIKKVESEPE